VFHRDYFNPVLRILEEQTIIAHPEPQFWRIDALKAFDVTLGGGEKMGQSVKDAQGRLLVNRAELSFCAISPNDILPAH
jgi:hypothetical protein